MCGVLLWGGVVNTPQPYEWGWGSPTATDKDPERESVGVRTGHLGPFWTCTVQHRVKSHNGVQHVCGPKAWGTIQGHVPEGSHKQHAVLLRCWRSIKGLSIKPSALLFAVMWSRTLLDLTILCSLNSNAFTCLQKSIFLFCLLTQPRSLFVLGVCSCSSSCCACCFCEAVLTCRTNLPLWGLSTPPSPSLYDFDSIFTVLSSSLCYINLFSNLSFMHFAFSAIMPVK